MGFFSKIRSSRLFFGKKEPSLIVRFEFRGKMYIVEEFDLDFNQNVGLITITISDIPDDSINDWVMDSYQKRDGEFRFLSNDGMIREGAQLQITFKDAYCLDYQKVINPTGAGVLTTLVISPRYLRIGNEEFEKR